MALHFVIHLLAASLLLTFPLYTESFLFSKTIEREMGLIGSATVDAESSSSPRGSTKSEKKQKKMLKVEKVRKWKETIEKFSSQVLHESYLNSPVRATTMETASFYPVSSASEPSLMPGSHKHLGGAYDPTDGCIYGVPATSKAVLCLYPNEEETDYKMTCIPLPDRVAKISYKWLRGILADGYLWAIPAWADSVLCVDVDAFWGRREKDGDIVKLIPLPEEHPKDMQWQWHGAGLNKERTAIYCIPSNAQQVLKVDLARKETSLINIDYDVEKYPNFRIGLANKWYGGILGNDNAVYGVCYRSCAVLKIDCTTDTACLVGPDFGCSEYNWHGGIAVNGKIYAHPSHAPDTVLVIDTNPDRQNDSPCYELPIQRADYDNDERDSYKWLGGTRGADGHIYCPACDTSSILKINIDTEECTTFGFAGTDKNKWQGGVLGRDGCIYCIPASGRNILRIATQPGLKGENPVQLIGDLPGKTRTARI